MLFDDGISVLDAYWYLHVNILNKTNLPVENVTVTVYDNADNIIFEGQSDVDGWIRDIAVHEYIRNQTTTTTYTPHNITSTKTGVGSAKQSNVTMDCSRAIALILENTLPTLTSPDMFPKEHDMSIDFTYTVVYSDLENDAPGYVRVNITGVLRPSGENWSMFYEMGSNETTYREGCVYKLSTKLPKGNFTYRFETEDWEEILLTTDTLVGPNITNRPAFIYPIIDQTATVSMPYICQANATDDDNDTLTYSLLEWPSGMRINSTTGLITWVPSEEQVGDNNVTVEVRDGDIGGMVDRSFIVRVHVNYPPILLKSLPDISFEEDSILPYALNLSEYFVDLNPEDVLTYSYYGAVNVNVTINLNATVNFSAAPGWSGTERIIFRTADPGGGYAEDSIDVIVNPVNDPPVADAGANQTVIANEIYGKVRLWGTAYDPDGSISLYEWDFQGDGTYDWSFPYTGCTVYTYEVNGTYNATLRVTDNEGETAIDTCTITALELGFDLPIASAKVIDRSGHWGDDVFRVGHLVEVSGEDSHDPGWYNVTSEAYGENGTIVGYDWDWRDLTPHNGTCNATHRYDMGQWYEIVLTVYDNQSFTNTTTYTILIVYGPTADAGPDGEVKMGMPITLYGKGYFEDEPHGSIVSYEWDFGDGATGSGATVTHTYSLASGEDVHDYTATLTVTDNYGFSGSGKCKVKVVRNYLPIIDPGPSKNLSTYGEDYRDVSLVGKAYDSYGYIVGYEWEFGDGSSTGWVSITGNPSEIPITVQHRFFLEDEEFSKTFTTNLTVEDDQGGTTTGVCVVKLTRNFPPTVCIFPQHQRSLGDRWVDFYASADDPDGWITGYSWSYDDESGDHNDTASVSHLFSKPDSTTGYHAEVTVRDNYNDPKFAEYPNTAFDTAFVRVYSNFEPFVRLCGNQFKYMNETANQTFTFLAVGVDIDGDIKNIKVEYDDGTIEYMHPNEFTPLTDEQKEWFATEIENRVGGYASTALDNPLFRMLEDVLVIYDWAMANPYIEMPDELNLKNVYDEWAKGKREITPEDMQQLTRDMSDRLYAQGAYLVIKAASEAAGEIGGAAAPEGTSKGGGSATILLDLVMLGKTLADFAEWVSDMPTFEKGFWDHVDDFIRWGIYDLSVKWGLIEEPLITREELMERTKGYTFNCTYTDETFPAKHIVKVTFEDKDNGQAEDSCSVIMIDNIPPIGFGKGIGRINENITFYAWVLDYEQSITRWLWDFNNDGEWDWNSSVDWGGERTDFLPSDISLSSFDDVGIYGPMFNMSANELSSLYGYTTGGIYTATLRVTDHKGYNSTSTCEIYVYPIAEAGDDKTYRVKKDVLFNGMGQTLDADIDEYWWDTDGDGDYEFMKNARGEKSIIALSKEKHSSTPTIFVGWYNVTNNFSFIGHWDASFRIQDNRGAVDIDACTVTITPNHAPVANAGPDRRVKCSEMTARFDASKSSDLDEDPLKYFWEFGDGSATGWLNTPYTSRSYTRLGTYKVNLTVKDDLGDWSTDSCLITVTPDAGPDQTVWIGTLVDFNATCFPNVEKWTWDFRDGSIGYGKNVKHLYAAPGKYQVMLTARDDATPPNEESDTCIITVIDNYIPEVSVGPEIGPEVGVGSHLQTYWSLPLTFYATACDRAYPNGSIVRYSWDFGDGSIVEGDAKQDQFYYYFNYTYTYSWFGEYVVNLTVWDERGASNWTTCNVTIVNPYGDIFSPVGTVFTLIEDTYSYQGTVTFVVNVSDDTDRNPYVDVWLNDEWYEKANYTVTRTYWNTTLKITVDMNILNLGDHILKVRAIDLNGNIGWGYINFTVIDDRAPESYVNIITPYWHNNEVTITANASDERSNITNVTLYYYNSTDNSTWYGPYMFGVDETSPWTWNFNFQHGEGYYRFYSIAWDEAGNQENFIVNDTVCGYDITLPESEVNIITPYWQTNAVFIITATANDNLSGTANIALYYRYSPDNVTWNVWTLFDVDYISPWEWNFNTSEHGDGYYQFYTIATDIAGNTETAPTMADTYCAVDTGIPKSNVTSILPYWQTTTEFTITANASNGMSGVSEVELWYRYSSDDDNWSAWTYFTTNSTPTLIDGHNYTVSFAFTSPEGDGYYEFYTIAKDVSGNIESAPTEADTLCGVDITKPYSTVTTISPYWQNTIPITTIVDASDITSGIKEVALYYNYSADNLTGWTGWTIYGVNDATYPYKWLFNVPNGDGYYQFYSIAVDNAGNLQETILSIAICGVDTVAPTTTDNAPVGWQNTTVTVTLTPIDALSGVAYTEYKLWLEGENEPANWSRGIIVMIDSDGIWNIKYCSVDNAGNIEANNTVQVQVDMTAPSTSCELTGILGDNNWFTTNVTVTLTATDSTSGVNYTKYRVDYGGDWMMYDSGFELSTEGVHAIEYYSVDNANNVEKVSNITVKIDKTPPSTESTINGIMGENNWYASDVTVNLLSSDSISGMNYTEYNLDGGGWQIYTNDFTVTGDGEHVVNYRSVDNAGNIVTYKTVSFKIDQTPPTAESIVINNGDEYTNTTTVQLSLSASDSTSGVWKMQFKNELNGTWSNWSIYNTSVSWTLQDLEGEGTVYFRVKDMAGLTSTGISDSIILDKTQPAITKITATPTVQEIYGYVNITATVTDNFVVDTVEIEIIYPDGTHRIALMNRVDNTDIYYYNVLCGLLGEYTYIIRGNDLAGNLAPIGEGTFLTEDTTLPEITNVQASPQTQDVFDSVNITCNVVDNVNVKNVYVNITDPQGISVSMLMGNIAGRDVYYYNTTYQINGTYQYSIWTIDTSDNKNSSMSYAFNIIRRTTTLIYTGETNGQYSDNVILSAMLMDTKTGTPISNKTLEFAFADYDGICVTDENCTALVTVTLTQIPSIYAVTIGFLGDEHYLSSDIDINFTVEKENTVLSSPSIDIVYSDDAILIITMTDEEDEPILHQIDEPKTIHLEYYNMTIGVQRGGGSCWIPLGNATLINGTATFELSIPENFDEIAGIYNLTVRFDGDSRYNPANATGLLTICRENVVISDPSFTIVYSDNTTITITILDDDNESLLHEEDVEITLMFYHTVWRLRIRWDPWTHEFIVEWVRENVWTEIDRTTMINGSITFNVSIPEDFSETAGNYSLRAVFGGNDRYNFASTDGTLTILKENVVLSDPSFMIVYMNSTNVTINITDDDGEELIKYVPSGPFVVRDGWRIDLYYFNGTEWKLLGIERLRNGSVTFDISMPNDLMEMPGVYELMLCFDGNGTYNDAVRYGNLTIIGGETNLTYVGASSEQYSDDVLLSAVLTDFFGAGMPNRTITFTLGNQTVNATTNETGIAMATITLMQIPGNYTLTAEFLGDEYYFSNNVSVNFTIEKKDTILIAYDTVVSDPANDTLTTMLMEDSTPIAGRNINFYINNTCIGTGVTNETGISTCSIPFIYLFGNFTWAAEFMGDDYYLPSNNSANLSSTHEAKVNGIITMIDKLITDIENSNITDCVASSLISKLQNAKKKVTQENFNAADNIMNAFQNELDAQNGKELSEEQYQNWYSQSENIGYALQWMMSC
ncbi:MAG: PKD domain-containing protein [Thermoplasmatales archaeon]|nr:PKD domain-containing protein [Thermoplasmatales archaeon]